MKILENKRFLIIILALLTLACSSSDDDVENPDDKGTEESLEIEKASFTRPSVIEDKGGDGQVMDELKLYINNTPDDATIYINIYLFDYDPILDAIKDAYDRGVTFKILIDNRHDKHTRNKPTIDELKEKFESPSEIIPVDNDARPSMTAIDHNKYVLFSEVDMNDGKAKNLVWASSHNFSQGQTKKLEDAVIMTNKELYNSFKDNWKEIAGLADSGMLNFEYSVNHINDDLIAYFFPRLEGREWDGKSTIIEQLDKIDDYEATTVRVLMSEMHAEVGLKIAKKLTELAKKGANVEVITRAEEPASSEEVLDELENNLNNQDKGYVKLLDASKTGTVHSKTMLIKGSFDGKDDQHIILTGSLNYHTNATGSNNNFLLFLRDSSLFEDYWDNFSEVKDIF